MSTSDEVAAFWEARYAQSRAIWSGRVNAVLQQVAETHSPGTALDLGCGEGGDAVWLASRGWTVTGVDVSETAVARGRDAAHDAGIDPTSITLVAADLSTWDTSAQFDLVTSAFLHSWPVDIPRDAILRRSTRFVAPGGSLLILAHAAAPPWADPAFASTVPFPTPRQDLQTLALDEGWIVDRCGLVERQATGPDGQHAALIDSVVLVHRRA